MVRISVWALLAFCTIALLIASGIHLLTFFDTHLVGMARYFWLHVAVIAVWVIVIAGYKFKGEPLLPKALPSWSRLPIYCLFGYFIFNMIFLLVALQGGSPEIVDGSYQLNEHGKLIQYLTEEEYYRDITIELRFFSSGWLIGYAATIAYLWHLKEIVTPGFREIHIEP